MYRIIITATVLVGAYDAYAFGEDKKADQDESVKKVIDVIRALEKKAESAPKVEGKQPAHEFVLISKICDTKNTFDDLLKCARALSERTTDEKTKNVLRTYIVALETTARKKKERADEKSEIKKLIYALRDQREFQSFTSDDAKSPAAKLLTIGKEAVPYLIDELDNDELSRSVSPEISTNRKVVSPMYVLRIGDCVNGILNGITGQSFGESLYVHDPNAKMSPKAVREKAKKWWDSQKQK